MTFISFFILKPPVLSTHTDGKIKNLDPGTRSSWDKIELLDDEDEGAAIRAVCCPSRAQGAPPLPRGASRALSRSLPILALSRRFPGDDLRAYPSGPQFPADARHGNV